MLEIVKQWRKQLFVALLIPFTAVATEAEEKPPEEVIVTGIRLDVNEQSDLMAIGLSSVYLIHIYDEIRDEWRFVRASNEEKKDESTH